MPPAIDAIKAAHAMTLGDMGYQSSKVAEMVDISQRAAYDIIKRHGRWGEVAERPVFAELRQQQKAHLEATSRMLSAKCLIQVDNKINECSAYQAAGIYGLLRTHERLDAGEPTEITASLNVHAAVGIDKLSAILGQRLIESNDDKSK